MASINKVILIGNLGADPEIRHAASGDPICSLRLATTDSWKDKASGDRKEATEWHRVVLYRRLGEIAGQYLKKGSQVYIEGRLRTRKWQDKNGQDRYTTEIEATEMTMLGNRAQLSESRSDKPADQNSSSADPWNAPTKGLSSKKTDPFDDDIPF